VNFQTQFFNWFFFAFRSLHRTKKIISKFSKKISDLIQGYWTLKSNW